MGDLLRIVLRYIELCLMPPKIPKQFHDRVEQITGFIVQHEALKEEWEKVRDGAFHSESQTGEPKY